MERALSFGSAAEAYERYRPGYPGSVVDLLLEHVPPGGRALEVGAGTGKATRAVAARGVPVTAVEPDPEMRTVLGRVTEGLPVTVVAATLETLLSSVTDSQHDLLYAAAAWHWTDPATRWARAASLLPEGGVFASTGGPVDLVDETLTAAVERVRSEVMATDEVTASAEPLTGLRWPGDELDASPWFTDVEEHDLTTTSWWDADAVVGLMSTVSAWLMVPAERRVEVLGRVRAELPERVEVRRELVLHRARRTGVAVAQLDHPGGPESTD